MYDKRLQQMRKKLNLTQNEIASQIGISYRAYSSYERGDRNPPLECLEKLAILYNLNLNWIIAGIGDMFNNVQPSGTNDELEQKVVEVMKKYGVIEK